MRNVLSFFRSHICRKKNSVIYFALFVTSISFLIGMKTVDAERFTLGDGGAVEVINIQTDKEKVLKETTENQVHSQNNQATNEKEMAVTNQNKAAKTVTKTANDIILEMSLKLSAKICDTPEAGSVKQTPVLQEQKNEGSGDNEAADGENNNDGSVEAIAGPQNILKINDVVKEDVVTAMGTKVITGNQVQYTAIDDIENAAMVARVKEEAEKEAARALAEEQAEKERLAKIQAKEKARIAKAAEKKRKAELAAKRKAAREKAKAEAIAKEQRATKKAYGIYLSEKEKNVLLRIVEAEATGEDVEGRMLVANVIINRIRDNEFPDTVSGVVFQKTGSSYQFSPIGDGRYWSVSISEKTKVAVKRVLLGEDISKGALYFMARKYASPRNVVWFDNSLTWLFQHGVHEFYK